VRTIWKFPITTDGVGRMPEGAEILSVQTQDGHPYLWALVNPSAPTEDRKFRLYGTGHHTPDSPGRYWGTFQLKVIGDQNLVFHLFELVDEL